MARTARQTEVPGVEKHPANIDELIVEVHQLTTARLELHAREKQKRTELIAALEAAGLDDGEEHETHDGYKATLHRGKTKVSVSQPKAAN